MLRCRCGCGEKPSGPSGWKWGHFNRGKKKGPQSAEHRAKLSISRMGKGQRFGTANPMYGKPSPHRNPDRAAQTLKVKMWKVHRHLLGRVRKRLGTAKSGHTFEQLGYSADELKRHLETLFEPGMTWQNHGNGLGKWNIDHIRPLCTFDIGSDPADVNALSNLRPLWWEQNMARLRKAAA